MGESIIGGVVMAVGSQGRKLRDQISNQKHREEKVNWNWCGSINP